MIEYCPWRYQWYCLSRRQHAASLVQRGKREDTKEYKIVVAGVTGSGKSSLVIRFISGWFG
jgi:GTPase SAR1 family protein